MNGKEYIHNSIHRNVKDNHRNFRYMKIQVTKCMISNTNFFPPFINVTHPFQNIDLSCLIKPY